MKKPLALSDIGMAIGIGALLLPALALPVVLWLKSTNKLDCSTVEYSIHQAVECAAYAEENPARLSGACSEQISHAGAMGLTPDELREIGRWMRSHQKGVLAYWTQTKHLNFCEDAEGRGWLRVE